MDGLRLKILDLGEMTFFKKELICTPDPTEQVVSPALAVLLHHPSVGYILYDTGNDPDWEHTYNDTMKQVYPITRLVSITDALAREGLTPADINLLILSHMHFDHVGGLRQFSHTHAGAGVIVSQAEYDCAMRECRTPGSAYMASLFCDLPGIAFRTVEGCYELAPGVNLFPQHCHTEGLMGLRVELPETGTLLFTSDSVYTQDSDLHALPPGGAINRSTEEFHQNLALLHQMQAHDHATLFYGHDIAQAAQWRAKGWIR